MQNGDTFYFVEADGEIETATYDKMDIFTVAMYRFGNFFATEKEAEAGRERVAVRHSSSMECVGRGTEYCFIDCRGEIQMDVFTGSMMDVALWSMGNMFFDYSEAWLMVGKVMPFVRQLVHMETDEDLDKAYRAMEHLAKFCEEHSCESCIFKDELYDGCYLYVNQKPLVWSRSNCQEHHEKWRKRD